jgi:DNA-binding transcriptional MerR regulator
MMIMRNRRSFKYQPKKLYRISEILYFLQQSGTKISRQTLHNYTLMGLISEDCRTPAGHRLYDVRVFKRLRKIELLKRHRTLSEIKKQYKY